MHDPKYQAVIDYLNDNFAYFCTDVLNLGRPKYTNAIPTAAVAITSDDGDKFDNFEFVFNPEFLVHLGTVEAQAFVFAHETLHILLDHLRLAGNFCNFELLQDLAKKNSPEGGGLTDAEMAKMLTEQKKMTCFNIAADCVINDWLMKEGFEPPAKVLDEDGNLQNQVMFGQDNVGHDCANYTVREVYNELLQKFQDQDEAKGEGGSVDSHDWLFQQSQKEVDAAKKLAADIEASGDMPGDLPPGTMQGGKNYSLTANDVKQDFVDQHGITLEWFNLLKEINPDFFRQIGIGPPKKASFHRARRKLGAFPDLKLPVSRVDPRTEGETDKIPAIVLALDTSGSISDADRKKFVTLARSVPQKKIKLFPITFTTNWKHLDLENPNYHSGGTCFSCIQDYINKEVIPILGHYPRAVVVVTDGEAGFDNGMQPTDKEFDSWFWLLTSRNSKHWINQWSKNGARKWDKLVDSFVKRG